MGKTVFLFSIKRSILQIALDFELHLYIDSFYLRNVHLPEILTKRTHIFKEVLSQGGFVHLWTSHK